MNHRAGQSPPERPKRQQHISGSRRATELSSEDDLSDGAGFVSLARMFWHTFQDDRSVAARCVAVFALLAALLPNPGKVAAALASWYPDSVRSNVQAAAEAFPTEVGDLGLYRAWRHFLNDLIFTLPRAGAAYPAFHAVLVSAAGGAIAAALPPLAWLATAVLAGMAVNSILILALRLPTEVTPSTGSENSPCRIEEVQKHAIVVSNPDLVFVPLVSGGNATTSAQAAAPIPLARRSGVLLDVLSAFTPVAPGNTAPHTPPSLNERRPTSLATSAPVAAEAAPARDANASGTSHLGTRLVTGPIELVQPAPTPHSDPAQPVLQLTAQPALQPTAAIVTIPNPSAAAPSAALPPSATAMVEPTATPTFVPTATATVALSHTPTREPTPTMTSVPTATTTIPTETPTATATFEPTATATFEPTATETATPIIEPTASPIVPSTPGPCLAQPRDMMLTIDASGSTSQYLPIVKESTHSFVLSFDATNNRLGLVSFSGQAVLTPTLTSDMNAVITVLDDLKASNGTRIDRGILTSFEELNPPTRPEAERVIVLLTDGRADKYVEDAKTAARIAKDGHVRLIVIGVGATHEQDRRLLHDLASSESDFYLANTREQLDQVYTQILASIACEMAP